METGSSPLQKIEEDWFNDYGITLFIKRDDLIHPLVQGNKWRKLKYNLQQAKEKDYTTLLTFGGAFSNHIYATAAAANLFGFNSIGIIRGESTPVLSPTLQFAKQQGMALHFFSREKYRVKDTTAVLEELENTFGTFYLIPEGGTNCFALKGVAEIIDEIDADFTHLCTAVGTGGTLAGIITGLQGQKQVIGFSSLKGGDTLTGEVNHLVNAYSGERYNNFIISHDYHFGGYAKVKPELIEFIKAFKLKHNIQLEPVYTGKMMCGIYHLVKKNYFKPGSRIIALHTGGLQGLKGFAAYFEEKEKRHII